MILERLGKEKKKKKKITHHKALKKALKNKYR